MYSTRLELGDCRILVFRWPRLLGFPHLSIAVPAFLRGGVVVLVCCFGVACPHARLVDMICIAGHDLHSCHGAMISIAGHGMRSCHGRWSWLAWLPWCHDALVRCRYCDVYCLATGSEISLPLFAELAPSDEGRILLHQYDDAKVDLSRFRQHCVSTRGCRVR